MACTIVLLHMPQVPDVDLVLYLLQSMAQIRARWGPSALSMQLRLAMPARGATSWARTSAVGPSFPMDHIASTSVCAAKAAPLATRA